MLEGRSIYTLVSIPLVSALVGYFTNWVAIRMLFRPYKEKRIFGIRIPFTPGLIPRKRADLAESIGLAVGEHLLTEEAIAARFADPQVKAKLAEIVHEQIQSLLARELGSINSLIPPQFQGEWAEFIAGLKERMDGWLSSIINSLELERLLREQISNRVSEALARSLGELLPQEWLDALPARLAKLLAELVEDERFERRVQEFLGSQIEAFLQADRPLRSYIPDRLRQVAYAELEESLPGILERLIGVLEDERVQKRIKIQLYELVDRLLSEQFREDSLWDRMKLGLFETFVISSEELKLRIDQGVEELAPRVAELVESPEVQRRIYQSLIGSLDTLLEQRLSEFRLDSGVLAQVKEAMGGAAVGLVRSPELRGRLVRAAEEGLAKLRVRPVKELLPGLAAGDGAKLGELLTEQILKIIRARPTQEALSHFLYERLIELSQRPIGRLGDYVPQGAVVKLERAAAEQLGRILQREAPRIIAALEIRNIVRERVEELSTEEMERLIVGVAGEQLRAITWFGAVLGFAIGLVQVAILLIRP
jgi:uncharacterized membrane protein YheB (UPF0754 family)